MGVLCFFNTAIAWGGGEKWHFETSLYLHSKGHRVVVVAHKKSVLAERLKQTTVPLRTLDMGNLSFVNPLKYKEIKKIFKKHDVSSVVLNLSRDLKVAGQAARSLNIKRIIYRRGSAIPIKNTILNRYYFKKVLTHILANSIATKRTINEKNPQLFPKENITVIYNGVDVSKITTQRQTVALEKNKVFTLLTLGRLEYQKNHAFLIEMARKLRDDRFAFHLLIGGDGRLKKELSEAIIKNGLSDHVTLCGFINEPINFISKADVFLLPSRWEGFGYVLAEAGLCKKPIIAFALSSNGELVLDGKTGFLTPENDIEHFCKKIKWLANNPKVAEAMGEEGEKHIAENFNKTKQLEKIEAYLLHG